MKRQHTQGRATASVSWRIGSREANGVVVCEAQGRLVTQLDFNAFKAGGALSAIKHTIKPFQDAAEELPKCLSLLIGLGM